MMTSVPLLMMPTTSVQRSFLEALHEYQLEGRYLDLDGGALSTAVRIRYLCR
jgi:hypothetical protein